MKEMMLMFCGSTLEMEQAANRRERKPHISDSSLTATDVGPPDSRLHHYQISLRPRVQGMEVPNKYEVGPSAHVAAAAGSNLQWPAFKC